MEIKLNGLKEQAYPRQAVPLILDTKDGEKLRDDSGKIVGHRTGTDRVITKLSARAADMMSGKILMSGELRPGDVASPTGARAAFWVNDDPYVADVASKVREVEHDRGVWWTENVTDQLKIALGIANSGGSVAEINPGFSSNSFTCTGYALGMMVPTSTGGNADFPIYDIALARLVNALRLSREQRVSSLLLATSSWAAANVQALGASAKWNGGTTSDVLAAVYASRANSALQADTLLVGEAVEPFVFAATGATTPANRFRDAVQAGWQPPRVVVGRAKSLVAGVPTYLWSAGAPASAVLLATPRADADVCTSRTLRWNGIAPDGDATSGMLVRSFTDGTSHAARSWIVVAHADAELMVSNVCGSLITGALQ